MADIETVQYHAGVCDRCKNNEGWVASIKCISPENSIIIYMCKKCLSTIINEWHDLKE
mgnify:CR=1 FL=1